MPKEKKKKLKSLKGKGVNYIQVPFLDRPIKAVMPEMQQNAVLSLLNFGAPNVSLVQVGHRLMYLYESVKATPSKRVQQVQDQSVNGSI